MLRSFLFLSLSVIATAAEKITYEEHILPILESSCTNCHNPDKKKGGLDLSSYSALMQGGSGGKVTHAGEGADSRMFLTSSHLVEPFMPPKGDKLDKKQLDQIRAWIDGGLLETSNSRAKKSIQTKISFSPTSLGKPDGQPPMPEHLSIDPVVTPSNSTAIHAMESSPWSPLLALTGQQQILLYNSDSLELVGVLPFPKGQPTALAFHPSGNFLTAAGGTPGKSGRTVTWNIKTGKVVATAAKEYDSILTTSIRADMQTVATGGPSRLIKTWNTSTNELEHSIKQHTDWVTAMSYSHDGVLLASGDRNGGLWIWESYSGQKLHNLRGHQGQVIAVKWSADSNFLASASDDGSVRFWDMNSGKQIKKIDAHKGGILSFDWAKDGHILTTGRDHKIKHWRPDYKIIKELKSDNGLITKANFSHDAKRFITSNFNGKITVWDSATHQVIGQMSSVPKSVTTRLAEAKLSNKRLNVVLKKSESELEILNKKHTTLQQDFKNNKQQLSADQASRSQLADQLKKLHASLQDLHMKVTTSKVERKELQLISDAKTNQLVQLQQRNNQTKNALEKLNNQSNTSQKKLDQLKTALKQVQTSLDKQEGDAELKAKIEQLTKELTVHRRGHMSIATSQASDASKTKALNEQLLVAETENQLAQSNFQQTSQPWNKLLKRQTQAQQKIAELQKNLTVVKASIQKLTAEQPPLISAISDTSKSVIAQEAKCLPQQKEVTEASAKVNRLELALLNSTRLGTLEVYEQAQQKVASLNGEPTTTDSKESSAPKKNQALQKAERELTVAKVSWQKADSNYWKAAKPSK